MVFGALGIVTAVIFVWSTHRGTEYQMARASCGWFAMATAVAIWLGRSGSLPLLDRLVAPVRRHPRRTEQVLLAVLLVVLLFMSRWVLDGFLNSGDEYSYFLQAQTFASGHLWLKQPSPASAFELLRFVERDGKWLSIYQPGWSLILTAPVALGLPLWPVNPILGALTAFFFFRLARRLVRLEAALLVTLGLCTSSFFLFNFGSTFSHGAGALTSVLFVLCGVRFLEEGDAHLAFLAGVALGALGFIRAINAVILVMPFVLAVLMTPSRRLGLLWFGLGGVPFAILLLAYNNTVTGNPLLLVQDWLMYGGEPIGPPTLYSTTETVKRLGRLFLWTSPAVFVGWPIAFLVVARRRQLSFVDWLAPLTIIGFSFYGGAGGDQYGPRYYFEGWSFALITAAKAIEPVFSSSVRRMEWVAAAVLGHLAFQPGYLIPRIDREHRVVMERQSLYREVAAAGLDDAVVLVLDDVGSIRPMPPRDLLRNGIRVGDEPVTYALDKDDATTLLLLQHFPGRHFYRYYRGELHDVLEPGGQFIPKPPGFF